MYRSSRLRRALRALATGLPVFVAAAAAAAAAAPPQGDEALRRAPPAREARGNLILEGVPAPDPAFQARLGRYLQSRSASLLDWLPQGGLLVSTRFGEVAQVHRVAAPLGMREQLTFTAEPIREARVPLTGSGFAYLQDERGDENAQVWYQSAPGTVRALTSGRAIHGSLAWAHDGKRLAFYGTERDGVSHDIYVADVGTEGPARLLVAAQQETWYPLDWSPDDTRLLLMKFVSITESALFVADVTTGALTPLDPSGRKVGIRTAKFAPDGRGIYLVSDEDGEFAQLRYLDPVTHQSRKITDGAWDVEDFDVTADGRYLAWTLNEDGRSRLTVLDLTRKLELAPAGLPDGQIGTLRFDRAGRRLAFDAESAQSPRDVYVYDLEHNQLERWTQSEAGPMQTASFVKAELVRYPTWDRAGGRPRTISAWVYRPRTPGPAPVVISIHGGPESQYRPGWEPFFQFLVNELGYAVIAPNVRGSAGYGRSFLGLDNGVLREDAVRDIGSLLVWIGLQPAFDRTHVAVMGGSYGGYMSLATLAAYGDRLSGGIDVVGISNFVTFLTNTSGYRKDLRRVEYGDERDPKMRAFLNRISPLTNAGLIRKPLLVVQGLNDPRVPASESEQMVWRVRARGGEVWYLAAKDEGHGFKKKTNRDAYLETAAQFLERLKH